MAISIRMNAKEEELINKYAELQGLTVSEVIRSAILERIEDEFDIYIYEKAYAEFQKNPKTYTIEEVRSLLGF